MICKKACLLIWYLLLANTIFAFNRQDTLRGTNGSGRNWWDVQHYELGISFDTAGKSITGSCRITFKITAPPRDSMQIDLQEPMIIDSIKLNSWPVTFTREGNAWWLHPYPFGSFSTGQTGTIEVFYHGVPRPAVNPPWDGGFIWAKDSLGRPWVSVACQGLGASCWWPCKDYQGDEPDSGMVIRFIDPPFPDIISNGRREMLPYFPDPRIAADCGTPVNYIYQYTVKNPINTYDVTFYAGNYSSWQDTLTGEKGMLDLTFSVLDYNETKAGEQFRVVKPMLRCFEHWFGPYPFYEDGYQLVEAPFLGMEHQSAVAYGNRYQPGYLGRDRSGTGIGLTFDYIIIHESGHEWFGNNITAADIADNWIHEGFTTYSEGLFAECLLDKEQAFRYIRGEWQNISNDRPVIGPYGVNAEGSRDMYDKGVALVHTLRLLINDDEQFRRLLRALNKEFYHSITSTAAIENYISRFAGKDFSPVFNQYLRTADVPELEYYVRRNRLFFRFNHTVADFTLPLTIRKGQKTRRISPTGSWQSVPWKREPHTLDVEEQFFISVK